MPVSNPQYDEEQLLNALRTDQFVMHYQPKVSLHSGRITGLEALIRWQHPQKGLLMPMAFLPDLQELGLMTQLGELALLKVCHQLAHWQAYGIPCAPVAVNIESEHFEQAHFVEYLSDVVTRTGADPKDIELELTEGTLLQEPLRALPVFEQLKRLGIKLSMDDFGSGYSGLNYLRSLPFDFLKIDRTYIRNIETNLANANIVSAVVAMAHSMGLQVVAEGAESFSEIAFLTRIGCDAVQGYYFSPPVNAMQAEKLLCQREYIIHEFASEKQSPWVLVLDDEKGIVKALQRVLKSGGYRTIGVCAADEALALMADNPADVVISDYRMPQILGIDFLDHIKKIYPDTARVLISGNADTGILSEAINKSCVDKFIAKPWSRDNLLADIRDAFEISRINKAVKAENHPEKTM